MRWASRRRAATLRRRREILARAEPEACPRCHREPVADGHELVRRAQGDTAADVEVIVLLGRACHDWVGLHPVEAHEEGWALWGHERYDSEAHRRAWLARLGFR